MENKYALKKEADGYSIIINVQSKPILFTIPKISVLNPLGKGAFGTVYKAFNNEQPYAIKQISKSNLPFKNFIREIQTMEKVPTFQGAGNLLHILGVEEDENYVYLLMPFADEGNLSSLIKKSMIKSELEALEYFRQICYGVDILHKHNIIHRNLKSDNILVQKNNDKSYPFQFLIFVCDYCLSKEIIIQMDHTPNVGTPFTRAPEVETGIYDYKADIYSLGCILYKMVTRCEPFQGMNEKIIEKSKAASTLGFRNVGYVSDLCLQILEGCLQYDKNSRLTMDELNDLINFRSIYSDYKPLRDEQCINMKYRTKAFNPNDKRNLKMKHYSDQVYIGKVIKQFKVNEVIVSLDHNEYSNNVSKVLNLQTQINPSCVCMSELANKLNESVNEMAKQLADSVKSREDSVNLLIIYSENQSKLITTKVRNKIPAISSMPHNELPLIRKILYDIILNIKEEFPTLFKSSIKNTIEELKIPIK